jgi:RNA polymerase sigma-70 factor (ECF subfamily)
LEGIYRQHRQGLYSLALSITRQPALAEDVIQEAFARLLRRYRSPVGDPVAYVFASVRNTAIDALRKDARHAAAPASLYNGRHEDPAGNLLDGEAAHRLRHAVDSLPDAQRQAVVMKVYAGLTFDQIAEASGEPLSTVSSRYQRALVKLKEALGDDV